MLNRLHESIAAVCPIVGVASCETTDDKGQAARYTRIDFSDGATDEQRAAAQSVADVFDWNAPPPPPDPTTEEKLQAALEWIDKFRAALQTADDVAALKAEDAKYEKLPNSPILSEIAR